jgi:hypothetical protein
MPSADDERVGRLLRAIRRRSGLTQLALALRAAVPRGDVMMIEAGYVGLIPLDRTRRVFDAVGGRARLSTFWNGAVADRLLDDAHARIVERALEVFQARGWETAVEVRRWLRDPSGPLRGIRFLSEVALRDSDSG